MRVDDAVPVARPRFIAANGRPLFSWHHLPPPRLRRGAGVVLCPPLGYEYMSAYPTMRILAERLAALGFDTLRVDYDGTGDSAGDQEEPGRVDAWLHSVACAIAETRRLSGSSLVALVGLRAGALLALQAAAAGGGVERLVLWSPFTSGRAYVRELRAFARLSRQDHAREDADEPGINAAGHMVTGETLKALDSWTLDAVTKPPAPQVLLVDRDDRSVDPILHARLEMLGSSVTRIRPVGTAEMLALTQDAKVPEHALEEITTWFRHWRISPAQPAAPPSAVEDAGAAIAVRDECRERMVRFGPGDRLFGVLGSPIDETTDAPAIVLLNTGVEYHVGPHRLYVPLAREWAARGHLVLRFDLGGIGDSAPHPGAAKNVAYPGHMLDDAREAIAFIRRQSPRRQVILAGLCSGGWLAFQAARQGLAVDAIVSVNPPLYLRDGAAGIRWLGDKNELERYRQSMRDPSKWVKALRGGPSYATFMRVAAGVLRRYLAVRVSGALGDVMPDGLAKDLCAIAARRTRVLFVFSRGDEGLMYFQLHAQPALRRAGVRDLIQHVEVEGAGHTFRPRAAQQALRELMTDFVASQSCGIPSSQSCGTPSWTFGTR
jgi:alpha-beta hydrolase superfamily lysophospholipase